MNEIVLDAEEIRPETKVIVPIIVDKETQQLVARDNTELVRMIKIFMNGEALPKTLNTEAKIITAWQTAASLRVPPIRAIQNMAIIHGSLSLWGELPRALAEATGELEDLKLFMIDHEYKQISWANKNLRDEVWAAVVQIKRKGRTENEYSFSLDDAKAAGLLNKTGPWKDYRRIMLARRTIGHAIKFEFPDALMGCKIAEYDFHEAPDVVEVHEANDVAADLNKQYLESEKK